MSTTCFRCGLALDAAGQCLNACCSQGPQVTFNTTSTGATMRPIGDRIRKISEPVVIEAHAGSGSISLEERVLKMERELEYRRERLHEVVSNYNELYSFMGQLTKQMDELSQIIAALAEKNRRT